MKPLVLILACLFLPMQTVSHVDCCCGDFCTHKNACTGCEEDQSKACEVHPNHQADGDCCKDKSAQPKPASHKKACFHASPSSEVTVQAADHSPPPLVWIELLLDIPLIQPLDPGVSAFLIEKVPRPESDVPLHLLLSVLQV